MPRECEKNWKFSGFSFFQILYYNDDVLFQRCVSIFEIGVG